MNTTPNTTTTPNTELITGQVYSFPAGFGATVRRTVKAIEITAHWVIVTTVENEYRLDGFISNTRKLALTGEVAR